MPVRQLTNLVLPELHASVRVREDPDDHDTEIAVIPLGFSRPCAFLRCGPSDDPLVWRFAEIDVGDLFQKRGIGTALLKLGADYAKSQGARGVSACCTSLVSLRTFALALGEPDSITDHDGVPITARELVMAIPAGPVRSGDREDWPSVLARWEFA